MMETIKEAIEKAKSPHRIKIEETIIEKFVYRFTFEELLYLLSLVAEKQREVDDKLKDALNDYIKMLGEEISDLAVMANNRGWKSTKIEVGETMRKIIKNHENTPLVTDNLKEKPKRFCLECETELSDITKNALCDDCRIQI